jgi:hypothetical protein
MVHSRHAASIPRRSHRASTSICSRKKRETEPARHQRWERRESSLSLNVAASLKSPPAQQLRRYSTQRRSHNPTAASHTPTSRPNSLNCCNATIESLCASEGPGKVWATCYDLGDVLRSRRRCDGKAGRNRRKERTKRTGVLRGEKDTARRKMHSDA